MKRTSHSISSMIRRRFTQSLRPYESNSCVVYAIELNPEVLNDPAFVDKNPNWKEGMGCVYVGMTSLTEEERCEQHLSGRKNSSRIAHLYGRHLRPDLILNRKAIRRTWALEREKRLAKHLRAQGFAVWQA